nr:haemoglobin A3 chain [Arenicola marina]
MMMKVVILLFALMACAMADCDIMQRLKVKQQWSQSYGTGQNRIDLSLALWKAILAQAPEAVSLFSRVNGADIRSPEFTAHIIRVMGGLDISISLLDNEPELNAELAHLRMQHGDRNIPDVYFDYFKNALGEVIPASLGRCYDAAAWSSCFDVIANGIKQK